MAQQSVFIFIALSVYLSVSLFICLSIYLSVSQTLTLAKTFEVTKHPNFILITCFSCVKTFPTIFKN